jgi:hypothetical protein
VTLSKRAAWFLIAVGVWSWIIWPTFLRNVWRDDRSWDGGPTGFFLVHLVLTIVSLAIGTAVGWLGVRGVTSARPGGRGRGRAGTGDPARPDRQLVNSRRESS